MIEEKYTVYKLHYQNLSESLFALVASDSLTGAESLLEKDVREKGNLRFKLISIEPTKDTSSEERVISNPYIA